MERVSLSCFVSFAVSSNKVLGKARFVLLSRVASSQGTQTEAMLFRATCRSAFSEKVFAGCCAMTVSILCSNRGQVGHAEYRCGCDGRELSASSGFERRA